ncbi:hypothetical protein T484DRAFT_2607184 [Baffinella frigidus]|nr:hypothetical protein T484DRAFT_2607184 [Cryptophyta sp. CCMP2293]
MCDLEGLEPSQCWDECEERHTIVGKVEQELRRKNALTCNLINTTTFGSCALEALRGDHTCGTCSDTELIKWSSALETQSRFKGGENEGVWNVEGFAEAESGTATCGTPYEPDTCDPVCQNMPPSCGRDACDQAAKDNLQRSEKKQVCSGTEDGTSWAIVGGVAGGVVILAIVGCLAFWKCRRSPSNAANPGTMEMGVPTHWGGANAPPPTAPQTQEWGQHPPPPPPAECWERPPPPPPQYVGQAYNPDPPPPPYQP